MVDVAVSKGHCQEKERLYYRSLFLQLCVHGGIFY